MANRVLIGKNTNTNLGFSGDSPGYGLWVSADSINVESATEAQLLYRTDIIDGTSGVVSANGAVAGVKYKGYTAVTTDAGGSVSLTVIKSWPKTDFTVDSTVYTPLCLAQMGKTAGAATQQWGGGWHASSGGGIKAGMLYFVNKNYSDTHSALLCQMPASGLASTTHRIYYAVCYPAI